MSVHAMTDIPQKPLQVSLGPRSKFNVTLRELATALWGYLEHGNFMPIAAWGFDGERELGESSTTISFNSPRGDLPRANTIYAKFNGINARSEMTKLGGDPIILWMHGDTIPEFQLAAVPGADPARG